MVHDLKNKLSKTIVEVVVRIVDFRHLPPSWSKKDLLIVIFFLPKYFTLGKLRSINQEEKMILVNIVPTVPVDIAGMEWQSIQDGAYHEHFISNTINIVTVYC